MIKRHSSHMLPFSLQHKVAGANERAGSRGAAWKHLVDDDEPVGSGVQAQANVTHACVGQVAPRLGLRVHRGTGRGGGGGGGGGARGVGDGDGRAARVRSILGGSLYWGGN